MGGMHDDEVIPLHAPFEVVLRGFNRQQVLDHLESLEGRIAMIAADRDAALRQAADLSKVLEHLRREAATATERVERLQRSSLGGAGVRIERLLQLAEDEITALRISTEQETQDYQARGVAGLHLLLRMVGQRLGSRVAEVEREVTRLTELRAEVTARLAGAHRALVEALGHVVQPVDDSHPGVSLLTKNGSSSPT